MKIFKNNNKIKSSKKSPPQVLFGFDKEMFTLKINGKLCVLYRKQDFEGDGFREYFQSLSLIAEILFNTGDESLVEMIRIQAMAPSIGKCNYCGLHANLLGGLCYNCSEVRH